EQNHKIDRMQEVVERAMNGKYHYRSGRQSLMLMFGFHHLFLEPLQISVFYLAMFYFSLNYLRYCSGLKTLKEYLADLDDVSDLRSYLVHYCHPVSSLWNLPIYFDVQDLNLIVVVTSV